MKTLTVKQPWASLIVEGVKDIENRTWKTNFRGRVLIHASAKSLDWRSLMIYLTEPMANVLKSMQADRIWLDGLTTGAIVGSVEIVDCVINHESIWAEKTERVLVGNKFFPTDETKPTYNWVLANPRLFPEPIPAKGKLGFWDYPNILAEPEERDGELFCHCQLPVKEVNQVTGSCGDYRCRY